LKSATQRKLNAYSSVGYKKQSLKIRKGTGEPIPFNAQTRKQILTVVYYQLLNLKPTA